MKNNMFNSKEDFIVNVVIGGIVIIIIILLALAIW
tara:strand:- start:852 stop:956 length:105 start_codon:yes stop_codon:yes gene_type:complete